MNYKASKAVYPETPTYYIKLVIMPKFCTILIKSGAKHFCTSKLEYIISQLKRVED